jgi:CHAT domain-containing protein
MGRFYANLLGSRDGLKSPMPKAEALREAQQCLRGLDEREAGEQYARFDLSGAVRGYKVTDRREPKRAPATTEPTGPGRPYAHPYYWAAFILVGDPD